MKKYLITLLLSLCIFPTSVYGFSDVEVGQWHQPYIDFVTQSSLISGYADNTFRPDEPVTLAEFCVMISNAYYGTSLAMISQTTFDQWWEPYVYATYLRRGLTDTSVGMKAEESLNEGYRFNLWNLYANQPLTRNDGAMIVYNIIADRYIATPSNIEEALWEYNDVPLTSSYAKAIATTHFYNLLRGVESDGSRAFQGDNLLNRAEAAVILYALNNFEALEYELRRDSTTVLSTPEYTLSDYNYTGNMDIENYVFARVNELRASLGLNILTSNNTLVEYAYIRAQEAEVNWAHVRPDGTSWSTVISPDDRTNYLTGENLTMGSGFQPYEYADMIYKSWLYSPSHYENMISPSHQELGIAVYVNSQGHYYAAQIFGRPYISPETSPEITTPLPEDNVFVEPFVA